MANCSDSEKTEIVRRLCLTDTYFLLWYALGRSDLEHPWLLARCKEVDASPNEHIDLWSREHYKSTIITFGLTIRDVLNDPESTIGIFSHTRPIAKGFLRQIKREFETNGILKSAFPDILWADPKSEAPKWSEDEGIIVRRKSNPKEATIEAWGIVDGQPTSKHFRVLVYDDVVTKESVTTPEMIEKTTDSLGASYNLGAEGGVRRFIGTRWHFNDTYKTVIERGTASPRIYPATVDGDFGGDPVLWSRETLSAKRRDMGPYVAACQLMQNPKADETQGFKSEWLRKYRQIDTPHGFNVYVLIDPASEKKKGSDYTAGWVVGLGRDENIYVLDMVRDRLNLTQRCRLVMDWHGKYKPREVRYEKYGLQADIEHIQSVQEKDNYRFAITEVGGQTSKADRIKRLIPYFEQGRVWLPPSLHKTDYQGQLHDLVEVFIEQEYKAFPVPLHDDMLDALARLLEPDIPLVWPKPEAKRPVSPSYQPAAHGWMG